MVRHPIFCINPFQTHKKQIKTGLRKVTDNIIKKCGAKIEKGSWICKNCLNSLVKENVMMQSQAHQSDSDIQDIGLNTNSNASFTSATSVVSSLDIEINTVLPLLKEIPVKKKGLTISQKKSTGRKKYEHVTKVVKRKLECSYGVELPCSSKQIKVDSDESKTTFSMAVPISNNKCLQFMKLIGKLKHLKRTGWVKNEVRNPETVSGHMYRMAIMSMLFDDADGINADRVLRMSLVHDMAESIVGDITPHCGVSENDKHNKEVDAMQHIKSLVGESSGDRMFQLFMEYEDQKTPESHLVKDLDKFDMILQAFEYETEEKQPGRLDEFFQSTEGIFKHPKVIEWVNQLKQERKDSMNISLSKQS